MAGGTVDLIGRAGSRTELADAPSMGAPFGTLVDTLCWRGEYQADQVAYRFLADGELRESLVTYGELDRRARALAALFQSLQLRGERALLVYPSGLEFVAAFFACLYTGSVPVVLPPPPPSRLPQFLHRLEGVSRDATPSLGLTTGAIRDLLLPSLAGSHTPEPDRWLATDELQLPASRDWSPPGLGAADLAFLQYTSGSTTEPRGVMVSHGNLIRNLGAIERAFAQPAGSESVCWLPPHHDMGLIGGILAPLYLGTAATLLPAAAFVQRPVRWLQAIARYPVSASGGPDFAYGHCVRRITPEQRAGLDLSRWEVAFCGAEPISARTLREFAACFAPCGFRATAFKPCYGLAEATLMVSSAPGRSGAVVRSFLQSELARHQAVGCEETAPEAALLPSSGRPVEEVAIVDPMRGTECEPGEVGEIWVSGPSVAQGYWNRPDETTATFGARRADRDESFLRTGDLGFLLDGELFVTGRLKDLIIVDGANHYPQDLERTVSGCHPAMTGGDCAAFSVPVDQRERLVVVAAPGRGARLPPAELECAIRTAVAREHDLRVHHILLVKLGRIPRTTSGKLRRGACRSEYLAGTLDLWGQQ